MHENGRGPSPAPHEAIPSPASDAEKPAVEMAESRTWHEALEGYVEDAHTDKTDLSLIFIDIDALKTANDELGHAAGDRLINMVRQLAQVIPQNVRSTKPRSVEERSQDAITSRLSKPKPLDEVVPGADVAESESARLGGDEFGIVLPLADKKIANMIAGRLREALAAELEKPENAELAALGVGISLGIATLQPDMTASNLLRAADQAMYANKLKQLRPLSPQEEADFRTAVAHLEKAGIRPRDVPKYLQMLGASAVVQAIENRVEPESESEDEPTQSAS